MFLDYGFLMTCGIFSLHSDILANQLSMYGFLRYDILCSKNPQKKSKQSYERYLSFSIVGFLMKCGISRIHYCIRVNEWLMWWLLRYDMWCSNKPHDHNRQFYKRYLCFSLMVLFSLNAQFLTFIIKYC